MYLFIYLEGYVYTFSHIYLVTNTTLLLLLVLLENVFIYSFFIIHKCIHFFIYLFIWGGGVYTFSRIYLANTSTQLFIYVYIYIYIYI